MEKNDFPLNWFILKSQLEMRGKTNVYQITPDRVNSEFLFLWQEKKKRTAKEIKSQKKKVGGAEYIFSSQDGIGYCHWKLWWARA